MSDSKNSLILTTLSFQYVLQPAIQLETNALKDGGFFFL